MRSLTLAAALCATAFAASAQGVPAPLGAVSQPLWMRHSALSPDGTQVAFAFEGNLFVVPATGGTARVLVANGHHSAYPVWSPDSRNIAYATDVYGNFDVFLIAAEGGPSRRLTTHSAPAFPLSFTPDGQNVLFSAERLPARADAQFASRAVSQLYQVSVEGGRRPTQVLSSPALAAHFDRAGTRLLYEDWKGYESLWRKHHVSPIAHDLWLWDAGTGQHRQLTHGGIEYRDPVWSPDERAIYFLSEKSGSFNVWKASLDQPDAMVQVTHFTTNPVRFLSIARDGTLGFGYDGELYTLAPGAAEPAKLAVRIAADARASHVENLKLTDGVTDIAPSPDGQEVAFVVRGQLFVASTEFGNTRRLTEGAPQARTPNFSPDGRRIVYASEREGSWNLYEASLAGSKKDAPTFYGAASVQTRTLLKNTHENFQPHYSPDGKEVAYLEDRVTLKVLNLASGQSRVVLPGRWNYSYNDGDQWYDWSPDGRSLLVTFVDRTRFSQEVGLVDAQGQGALQNLTQSGYEDSNPLWVRAGQAMLWFSDRMGLHGPSDSAQKDVFAMFFTREAYDRHRLDPSEYAQLKHQEEEDKKALDDREAHERKGKPPSPDAVKLPPAVAIERDRLEDRIARLTPTSADLKAAALTPDGETLYYVAKSGDAYELWLDRMRDKVSKKIADLPAGRPNRDDPPVDLRLDAKGENAFVLAGGTIQKFKVPKDNADPKVEPLKFSAEMRLDRSAERAAMFDHVWRQTLQKLYVSDMNGVDWPGYRRVYERFSPYIADSQDFTEMLSEMLGELNVSHTGSGARLLEPGADDTAALGAFFDDRDKGPGLRITEVIEGGPLEGARSKIRAGMVIEKIDGIAIAPGAEVDSLLNQKAGKRLALSVFDPGTGVRFDQAVKPIAQGEQLELLYKRWVKAERERVDRLSGGRLGYVHVRGMDEASYRDTFAEVLGRNSAKEALIVDTRFNGGGNLHDALATLLSGKRYLEYLPRGESFGFEPDRKWTHPSLVIISESNYSDAHLFPWVYRHLGIGKLLGMPVAGTGTAVWWETLQDGEVYFGIPEIAFRDDQGHLMESALIEPDIRVPNDPGLLASGRDQQLEAAVKELLGPKN